ncbi:hypothetical protein AR686_17550 [Chryseobacterium aquaticum subsp. greenlandense]|uniref:Uncharacterized protein n=1 Tax=Chryseobacterium aquaticum subsp. greenlandense TaxID=345663 RepID=A0A101CCZ8_9FLAO|nr:hypothetical protein AR686_17550 [Chryseobacterium aquaticum subsp. greenlandense]
MHFRNFEFVNNWSQTPVLRSTGSIPVLGTKPERSDKSLCFRFFLNYFHERYGFSNIPKNSLSEINMVLHTSFKFQKIKKNSKFWNSFHLKKHINI